MARRRYYGNLTGKTRINSAIKKIRNLEDVV